MKRSVLITPFHLLLQTIKTHRSPEPVFIKTFSPFSRFDFLLNCEAEMEVSRSSASTNVYENGNVPLCGCRRPMKMWVAKTVQNRNRRFWKCRNAGLGNSCDVFMWDDEVEASKAEAFCKNCELAYVKYDLIEKKYQKAKMKSAELKREFFQFKIGLVVACVVFGFIYKFM